MGFFDIGTPIKTPEETAVLPLSLVRPEVTDASPLSRFEWRSPIEWLDETWGVPMGLIGPGEESDSTPFGFSEMELPLELIATKLNRNKTRIKSCINKRRRKCGLRVI